MDDFLIVLMVQMFTNGGVVDVFYMYSVGFDFVGVIMMLD